MARVGNVVRIRDGRAQVLTSRRGPCEGCAEKASCGQAPDPKAALSELVDADNPIGAEVGDTVEFDLVGHAELHINLLIWVVPLIGLIGGAAAGVGLSGALSLGEDPAAALGALIGAVLAYAVLRRVDKRAATDERMIPRVLKVVERGGPPTDSCSSTHGSRLAHR